MEDYASRDIMKQSSVEAAGKVNRKRLKKFKSDTFGGVFTFNAGSGENSELSDGHPRKLRNKRPTDLDITTFFQRSEPIEEVEEREMKTDPQKVLNEMMQEPGLNEKIFKMFTQFKREDDDDDESQLRTPTSPDDIEV